MKNMTIMQWLRKKSPELADEYVEYIKTRHRERVKAYDRIRRAKEKVEQLRRTD